jgi:spermidine synthase
VLQWCQGPLAELTDGAVHDPRVTVEIANVAEVISRSGSTDGQGAFDAIVFDLYKGPHFRSHKRDDPLYGSKAIDRTRRALTSHGVFAVWGENYDGEFDKRLRESGFAVTTERPGRGGLRHVVFLAKL